MKDVQLAKSAQASSALKSLTEIQEEFAAILSKISHQNFEKTEWKRQNGKYGGGHRLSSIDNNSFNQASINISQVQYEDDASRSLNSATALSTIIHAKNPFVPSIHIHISWTEFKDGKGYWRIMADLNPSITIEEDRADFENCLQRLGKEHYEEASENGLQYFDIPVLKRKRGVSHFYLEGFSTDQPSDDHAFAINFGFEIIKKYGEIFAKRYQNKFEQTNLDQQLDYHTLYFFQVTTLDRGTIAGLLVHDENDVGILGSLPRRLNPALLKKWANDMPAPTEKLLLGMVDNMPKTDVVELDEDLRAKLAVTIRNFYKDFPESMDFLARGSSLPRSNSNHTPAN